MVRIEDFYAAAESAGLLAYVQVDGNTVAVEFRCPDDTVLDGLALSSSYSIRYPATLLPGLAAGHNVTSDGTSYRVRDVRAIGDGSERHADLSRI